MSEQPPVPLNPGTGSAVAPAKESPAFKAGAVLLILANIACGVFAFLAGQEVGNKNLNYAIAFTFLGIIFIGIFALAHVDNTTRREYHDWEFHH
jgi:hypothetical protein